MTILAIGVALVALGAWSLSRGDLVVGAAAFGAVALSVVLIAVALRSRIREH
ncbi:MAG: hypothetical protein FWC87_13200 [Acidimicrobiaceae bacterium]|nr:hypothetical protein [Acidimicrobiaceae bacterium]